MKLLRRRWLKMGTLLGASALLWSCVAPILTVPPPGAISFESTMLTASDGTQQTFWIASGPALEQAANATYFVFDRTLGSGVIATARNDGSFTATQFYADIEGHPSDPHVRQALEELRFFSEKVRILGVYKGHPMRGQL